MRKFLSCRLLINGNTRKVTIVASLLAYFLVLTGCGMFDDDGMFRNKGKDYKLAAEKPYIKVPEGLDGDALGELYRIPLIPETSVLDEEEGTPRPQLLSTNVLEEEVKVQSLGERRWILINREPSEVWPRVRNILNRNGIPTASLDAAKGVIETVWLEFDDSPDKAHRYRFSIEQGVQPKSTEILILHSAMTKAAEVPVWPAQSDEEAREKTMLNVLASSLAGDESSGTVSLLAQEIGGASKVDVLAPKGKEPYMLLKLDYDRSWASVGYSVSRDNFSIVDQDRTGGVFYVGYSLEEEDKPGFIRRLFGAETADKVPEAKYQVRLIRGAEGVEVRVFNGEQSELERTEALRLLNKIRANLS